MPQKVLIATTNPAKLKEMIGYLSDLPIRFVSLRDVGITEEVIEDGITYKENSQKKALEYARLSGLPAISDDGGLEIDALGGAPGVNSKYFGGKSGKDEDIFKKMQKVALDLPNTNRNATFFAVLSFALPNGKVWSTKAQTHLQIARKPLLRFVKGFPFRAFLFLPEINKYYHDEQMSEEEHKKYNHRYIALEKLRPIILKQLSLSSRT